MQSMLNVYEAKSNFSSVLAEVERKLSTFTIMRYGRPIAKIVPIVPKRNMGPLPGFVGKVKMHADWFADESSEWENA